MINTPHSLTLTHLLPQIACEIVEFALDTGLRLLYLFLCLLAVLRAMVITFPYHNTLSRYRHITLRVILLSVFFLSGQSLVPIVTRHYQGTGHCGVSLRDTFSDETVYKAWRICTVLIQVVLAMVVMLISNAVSIHGLLKSRTARNCARKNARTSAAATTVILTMSFFLLHITGVVLMSCVFLKIQISSINYFIANGFSILSPVVDPFVYFLRLSPRCAALTRPPSRTSKTTQFTELVSRGSSGWNLRTKPAVFLKLSNSKEEQDNKTNGHTPELGHEQDVKTEVDVTMDVVTTV